MVDQIYYKIQYPLKKAIDLMKDLDSHDLDSLGEGLSDYDREKIASFIEDWNNGGREKLTALISDLRAQQ
ncbi:MULTISPECIES: hypothetical protein [Halanaerobium]|uniref:Uncharacterized protein n=1 Tax=Halanaerobium kushneri TaxID=56779 RepID=A0A1N6V6G0_9FIRM|nr:MULTISPECIES: hypothetical protein [Halanaerobium]RCW52896.1 hypothetical protein DFR80_12515 [Halanaerobium sp. ST460_2HS_T2]SIQ73464.1 hypothetical protein SAMN05421834_107124 [Halanaerobium kushneri]